MTQKKHQDTDDVEYHNQKRKAAEKAMYPDSGTGPASGTAEVMARVRDYVEDRKGGILCFFGSASNQVQAAVNDVFPVSPISSIPFDGDVGSWEVHASSEEDPSPKGLAGLHHKNLAVVIVGNVAQPAITAARNMVCHKDNCVFHVSEA